MSIFHVELKKIVDDSYPIEIGFSLGSNLTSDLAAGLLGNVKRIAIITDSNVKKLYANKIALQLQEIGYQPDLFVFEAGEANKTRKTKEEIEDAMLEKGYRRDCAILAIGGGVVTDLAGFLAGTYGRGVPFINYATTLLAAADASIGGKTAVDTPLATNLIGLFHQPKKVYIDIETWKTLDNRQFISGIAETIKHACLADCTFFSYLESHMSDLLAYDTSVCEYVATQNCKIKYQIVMKDERESGLREVLNLGHTVGRAIETVSGYRLLHGEAISIGLVAEVKLAYKLGYMKEEECIQVISLLEKAGLPVAIPDYINKEDLIQKLYTDKKVRDGKLRFVIQNGIGNMVEFSKGVFSTSIEESLAREIIFDIPVASNTAG